MLIACFRGKYVVNKLKKIVLFESIKSLTLILVNDFSTICELIREYGSTLYVGLARAVSPTNTNFRLTFLLTRLQEALYEDLAV